jgi:hypothetical protein
MHCEWMRGVYFAGHNYFDFNEVDVSISRSSYRCYCACFNSPNQSLAVNFNRKRLVVSMYGTAALNNTNNIMLNHGPGWSSESTDSIGGVNILDARVACQ